MRRVHGAADRGEPVQAQRQLEILRLVGQVLAERELVGLVVDHHRVAERERRQSFGLLDRDVAQRRVLDEAGHVPNLQRPELQRVDAGELQPSQADAPHAGAERVRDRRDAEPLRRRPGDDRVFGSGVDDEILRGGVVDLRAHDDLVVHQAEVDRVEAIVRRGVGLERDPLAERAQETDLRARPVGFLAVVLVRQEVHVVRVRAGRFLVLVHPLEDRPDGVVDLQIARRQPQRQLRFVHRLREAAARRQRARPAVMAARQVRRRLQGRVVQRFGFLEESRRPERVAVERHRLRVSGLGAMQLVRLPARELEIRHAQRRGNDADPRPPDGIGWRRFQRGLVRVERVEETAFRREEISELQLDLRRRRLRRGIGAKHERRARQGRRYHHHPEPALHGSSPA